MLRELMNDDFDAIHEYASDPVNTQYMSFGPNSVEETRAFITRMQSLANAEPRITYALAIVLEDTEELIGGCGLMVQSDINKDAEMGYILNPKYHRRGFAHEACIGLIKLGFEQLGLHRIYAFHHPDNPQSGKVMRKLGMQYEGLMRRSHWIKNSWWDFHVYAIIEDDPQPTWECNN